MGERQAILSEGSTSLNVNEYVLNFSYQTSSLVPPADGRNATGEADPSVHGTGPVEVSVAGYPLPLDNLVMNASQQLGGRWAFNEDINAGNGLGTGQYKALTKLLDTVSDIHLRASIHAV